MAGKIGSAPARFLLVFSAFGLALYAQPRLDRQAPAARPAFPPGVQQAALAGGAGLPADLHLALSAKK